MPKAVAPDRDSRFTLDAERRVTVCDGQKLGGEMNVIKVRNSASTGRGGLRSFPCRVARVMELIDSDAARIDGEIEQQIQERGRHGFNARRGFGVARLFRLCARYQERALKFGGLQRRNQADGPAAQDGAVECWDGHTGSTLPNRGSSMGSKQTNRFALLMSSAISSIPDLDTMLARAFLMSSPPSGKP